MLIVCYLTEQLVMRFYYAQNRFLRTIYQIWHMHNCRSKILITFVRFLYRVTRLCFQSPVSYFYRFTLLQVEGEGSR